MQCSIILDAMPIHNLHRCGVALGSSSKSLQITVSFSSAPVLFNGPEAEVSEELCEGGGLIVGVEAAGVGEDPGVAAAEGVLLEADAGIFDA
jgi:hypothetical protein